MYDFMLDMAEDYGKKARQARGVKALAEWNVDALLREIKEGFNPDALVLATDIDARPSLGRHTTPLLAVCQMGPGSLDGRQAEVFEAMLRAGADIKYTVQGDSRNAIDHIINAHTLSLLQVLGKMHYDFFKPGSPDWIEQARLLGFEEGSQWLEAHRAEINGQVLDHQTPLAKRRPKARL